MESKHGIGELALQMVQNDQALGLGAGSTIGTIIPLLGERIKQGLQIELYTSSNETQALMLENGLDVHDVGQAQQLDLYFDGCDQFDKNLNALKSGGGIHTQEKILAAMADQFIIVADEKKCVDHFDKRFPLVLEILPQAQEYIPPRIKKHFPESVTRIRLQDSLPQKTINGNLLLEIWFESWPPLKGINEWLKTLPGFIESSLFYSMAKAAIVGSKEGAKLVRLSK